METVKQGHVAMRGHFMWRERYVLVHPGIVIIHRSNRGAVKAKIDLLDPSVRIVFHEDHTQFAISCHGHDTLFQCHSTVERDAWVSAVFTAKGGHGGDTDCETSDLVMSAIEDLEKEKATVHACENDSVDTDSSDDDAVYSDALLAFQGLRSSMMTLIESSYDDSELSTSAVRPPCDEATAKRSHLSALVDLIRSKEHGGRVVLLHLDVIRATTGLTLEDILAAVGEKQRESQQRTASSNSASKAGLQRLHISTFVRNILFHPLYSTHHSSQVDALIDRYFPHCRLRRFSHDVDFAAGSIHSIEVDGDGSHRKRSGVSSDVNTPAASTSVVTPLQASVRVAPASIPKADSRLHQKRHSFPNIMMPIAIGPLLSSQSGRQESYSRLPLAGFGPRSASDHVTSADLTDFARSNDSSLFLDDVIPQPLRIVQWRYSAQEIAEQLSIFHQEQLSQLMIWDLVQSPQQTLKPITDHFNRLVTFLVWSVLIEDSAKDRAEVIEWIIAIATAASTPPINNFHLVMACVGCLGDTPLMASRLPATWRKVRAKFKAQLVQLRALCDHVGGFEALRKRQAAEATKGACIPFVGVVGVALERLRLVPYLTDEVTLDVDKLERQYLAVTVVENAMLRQYKTQSVSDLQAWLKHKVPTIDSFATPRLLQLRSQNILVLETQQSSSRHSSLHRTRGSPGSAGSTLGKMAGDPGPPMLSFRDVCSILVTSPDVEDRIRICVEAVLADDRQPSAIRLRQFLQDFRQSACVSACHLIMAGVKHCTEAITQEILTQKNHEVLQLSGLEDGSIQLQRSLYCVVAEAITRPIAAWLSTKVKHAFAAEDAKVLARMREWRLEIQGQSSVRSQLQLSRSLSPVEILRAIAEALEESSADADHQTSLHCCLELLTSSPCSHPYSIAFMMQQSLDAITLPKQLREALELVDETLSCASTRASKRASLAPSSTARGSVSCKCLSIQPPELAS